MQNEILDEHEQSEQVRKWLKANGSAILFGIVLGFGALMGWRWWETNQVTRQAQAASQYVEMKKSVDAKNLEQLKAQTDALLEGYGKSGYSALAQLRLAQLALEKNDKAQALKSLKWVESNGATDELKNIARLRLARLHNGEGKFDDAIAVLSKIKDDAFVGTAAEVRGDSLRALNKSSDARAAYQQALDKMEAGAGNRQFIEMKLASVGDAKAAG